MTSIPTQPESPESLVERQAAAKVTTRSRPAPTATGIGAFIEATKPGITRLVTVTSGVGLIMALTAKAFDLKTAAITFIVCTIGTALAAAGANAINQYMEQARDSVMNRTRTRPLPTGRSTPATVLWGGIALSVLGPAVLFAFGGPVPALVAIACTLSYIAIYTPLKPVTTLATFIGAIPGALPPLIGYSLGSNPSDYSTLLAPAGIALFVLMFVWQIPHFLAIAWMYREDYAAGGYAVLPVVDPAGRVTSISIALWTIALLPATIWPAALLPGVETIAPFSAAIATITGLAFAAMAFRLVATRTTADARRVFFASIIHLPLVLLTLSVEAILRAWVL